MTSSALQDQASRLHALDALRAGALLLGLVVHASMAFTLGMQGLWIVHDPASSALLGLGFFVPHMFRMLVFFLIAGLFARMMLQRRGVRTFVRDRMRRILLVLIAFWPVTLAGIVGVAIAAQSAGIPVPPAPRGGGVPLFHLWFLYVLTLLYLLTLGLRSLVKVIGWPRNLVRVSDMLAALLASPGAALALAIPLGLALHADPVWIAWFGIPTPDQLGWPGPAASVGFGSAYALGWWLAGRLEMLTVWARQWRFHLVTAVFASAACLWLAGTGPDLVPLTGMRRVFVAGAYALGAWSWTFFLTGMAQSLFAHESPKLRHLADASYWIYLMHLPVVMVLQAVVIGLPLPPVVKFAIVVSAAFLLLLASYRLFVRQTWIGAWLSGRRRERG